VLHHREITYSVTAPSNGGSLRESYARINRLLLHALRDLGVDAAIAHPVERAMQPGASPCFEAPSEGELIVGGRKLVGSAQWRENGALLQHGSILLDDDQSLIASLMSVPIAPTPPPATLRASIGRSPTVEVVAAALVNAVRTLEDPGSSPLELDDAQLSRVRVAVDRFASDEWTWRR
jgi:lipoyl(octanoyl) transferase